MGSGLESHWTGKAIHYIPPDRPYCYLHFNLRWCNTAFAFDKKRDLFLRPAPTDRHRVTQQSHDHMNTYELEDILFRYLHKQKRLEFPFHVLGRVAYITPLATVGWMITIAALHTKNRVALAFFGFVSAAWTYSIVKELVESRKSPR